MKTLAVAVVTYRDREFKRSVSDVLKEYDDIHVKYCEALSPCYLQVDGLKLVLINADNFHSRTDREKELYNVMSDLEGENSPFLFMLTSNMSPEDFLRNQICNVTDTIDISGGMGVLTSALDMILPRKRQLGLFDADKAKTNSV